MDGPARRSRVSHSPRRNPPLADPCKRKGSATMFQPNLPGFQRALSHGADTRAD